MPTLTRAVALGQVRPTERAAATTARSAGAPARGGWPTPRPIPPMVRRAFLFVIATIPFWGIELPGFPLSPARIAGLLLVGSCLWYPRTCFRRPAPAVLWFSAYLTVVLLMGLFIPPEVRGQLPGYWLTMVQLVAVFWVGSTLLQDTRLTRQVLFTLGAASSALAVGTILQLPGIAGEYKAGGEIGQRAAAVGQGPNKLAFMMAVAAVMLIGLLLDNTRRSRGKAWLLVGMTAPLFVILVETGSRGGLLSFVVGASVFLIPLAPSRRRIVAFALGLLALIALGVMVARSPVMVERWTRTLKEGNVATRDVIWKQAMEMFLERPILGWGPVEFRYELGSRLNLPVRDPHNTLIYLLLEVGIVGALCFLAGFWLCARAAWRSRAGPEGVLPLALIVTVTVKDFSGSGLVNIPMWIVLAIALASPVVSSGWRRVVPLGNRSTTGGR